MNGWLCAGGAVHSNVVITAPHRPLSPPSPFPLPSRTESVAISFRSAIAYRFSAVVALHAPLRTFSSFTWMD